jgi:hypothetical protein
MLKTVFGIKKISKIQKEIRHIQVISKLGRNFEASSRVVYIAEFPPACPLANEANSSIGSGKMIVEFFSAEM